MAALSTSAQAISQPYLDKKVADTILTGNILTLRLLSNAKKWYGRSLDKGVQVSKPTTGGSFFGLDQFPTGKSNTKIRLSFDVRGYEHTITIEGMEADAVASDPNAAANYVQELMEEGSNAMLNDIADIFYADGTGNSNKDFLGLAAIVDDGGTAATYGNQSRSTYTTLKGNEYSVTGGLQLTNLATADSGARKGNEVVNLHVTTESLWSDYEALLTPTILSSINTQGYPQATRFGIVPSKEGLKGEAGFNSLYFRSQPVVADQRCPSGKWFGLNTDHLAFYGLESSMEGFKNVGIENNSEIDGVYSKLPKTKSIGLFSSGMIQSPTQYAQNIFYIMQGNLVSFNPNRHFQITFA